MKKIVCLLILLVVMNACKEKINAKKVLRHRVVKVTSLAGKLYFSGDVKPIKEEAISSPANARVEKLMFKYGMRVNKGDVLVVLDSSDMQKKYDEALTSYLKAKDTLDVGKAKFSGTERLWRDGLISKNAYDADVSGLHTNEIAFLKAKNTLSDFLKNTHQSAVADILKLNLSDFGKVKAALNEKYNQIKLKASISGVTLLPPKTDNKTVLRVGSQVKEADVITLIGDLSGLSIDIKVAEINVDKLKTGMKATVKGVAFPDFVLKAKIDSVNAQASSESGSTSGLPQFNATVVVPHLTVAERAIIKVGMSASVEIDLGSVKKIMVPIAALYQKQDKTWINIKLKSEKIKATPVITGSPTSDEVEIKQGLKEGDEIVWKDKPEVST